MRHVSRVLVLWLAIGLAGCESESSFDGGASGDAAVEAVQLEASEPADREVGPMAAPSSAPASVTDADVSGALPTAAARAQLIRTASVRLRALNHASSVDRARALTAEVGGFIGGESSQRYAGRVETTLTLRVPNPRFDSLLAAVSSLPGEVESREVSVDDVTRQIADVGARLETRRAAEAQYRVVLGRAGSIEDLLAVQRRLDEVRESIEATEAQLRELRDQVALSTIRLTVYEASAAGITDGPGFAARAGRALASGWDGLLGLILGLLALWPALLLAGLGVWVWRRFGSRRRARRTGTGSA